MAFDWNEAAVYNLSSWWREGLSASQIAAKLEGPTRNAVIGKVHRLGLSGRAPPSEPAIAPAPTIKPKHSPIMRMKPPRRQKARAPKKPRKQNKSRYSPLSDMFNATGPNLRPLRDCGLEPLRNEDGKVFTALTVSDDQCKYPIGDPKSPDFAFCARSCSGTYCSDHARLAYQPGKAR